MNSSYKLLVEDKDKNGYPFCIDFNIFPSVRSNVKRDWENLEPIKKNSPRISICLEAFPNDDRTLYGLSVLNLLIPKNDAQKNLFDFIRVYYTNYSYATKKQYEFLTKNHKEVTYNNEIINLLNDNNLYNDRGYEFYSEPLYKNFSELELENLVDKVNIKKTL